MSFYNFFRNIFGLPKKPDEEDSFRRGNYNYPPEDYERNAWSNDHYEDDDIEEMGPVEEQPFGFKIFSSPLEIHRFFEKQMNEMMKTFQMFDSDPMIGIGDFHSIEPPNDDDDDDGGRRTGRSLRDELFKPGYQYKHPGVKGYLEDKKEDNDLDESMKGSTLGEILDAKPSLRIGVDGDELPTRGPQIRVFGKSVTSKTVCKPDGSVEHHKTVRDNQGNEETIVTRQIGDKKYTVITHTDANGVIKRSESFQNMDEGEVEEFKKKWNIKPELDNKMAKDGIDFKKFFSF
ncbi:HCLS1-associated protein X-1 [Schistocerca nitens]|uniref:HCLS1-associated protein X-1 n=1 Tax=Schistocerca nitens TaxID=7011 RepID=UPI002117C9CD|nr:HCLS1-associated protein X-1 [Schistocerca nitens]